MVDERKKRIAESKKKWKEKNKEKVAESNRRQYEKNKKRRLEYQNKYNNENREKLAAYKKNNAQKVTALENKRRAAKLKRTPKWADLEGIRKFYENCPKGMHVDHIVPLQGRNVSGLHVLENLQYLTPEENASKSNKFEEDICQ